MKYDVRFFQPKEFICPCCKTGQPAAALVYFLDQARRGWDSPVIVNSGFRCARHNAEVGGAASSRHLIGCAADIKPLHPELLGAFKYYIKRLTEGRDGWEVIFYDTFVHVAVPRDEAGKLWNGGAIKVRAA